VNEDELKSEAVVASVTPEFEVYDDNEPGRAMPSIDPIDIKGIDKYDPDSYDGYITAQVLLPRGHEFKLGTVLRRRADENGKPIGESNDNPILDTRMYDVGFYDGVNLEYAVIVIPESLFAQVDAEGRRCVLMSEIDDHRKEAKATSKDDEFVSRNGKRLRRKDTKGWKLFVE
jgi:hypothetical protein